MPKLVDYSVRFELIREAVVRVAARDGGSAVDLQTIATEMRISPSTLRRMLRSPDVLAETGVVWVDRQRQQKRFRRKLPRHVPERSPAHVGWLLCTELPRHEEEVEWARAWAALAVTGAGGRIDALREAHDRWLDLLVHESVAVLAIPAERRELEAIRLRVLIDGVTAGACAGRIPPDQVETYVDLHLREISRLTEPHGRNSAESPNSCQR